MYLQPARPPLPTQERVLDKMADILWASDEILDMIRRDPNPSLGSQVESAVQSVYEQINELMKRLSD